MMLTPTDIVLPPQKTNLKSNWILQFFCHHPLSLLARDTIYMCTCAMYLDIYTYINIGGLYHSLISYECSVQGIAVQ